MGLGEKEVTDRKSKTTKAEQNKEFLLSHAFHLTSEPADLFSLVRLRDSIPTLLAVETKQLGDVTQVVLAKLELLRGNRFHGTSGR